jgi:hypothetical protein
VLIELEAAEATGARYRATVFTPEREHRLRVHMSADGALDVAAEEADVPADALELVKAMARTLVKDALAHTPPVWPRRLLRWRPG